MICNRCGKPVAAGASYCTTCNAPIASVTAPPAWGGPVAPRGVAAPRTVPLEPGHAGFWLRVVAYAIDAFVLAIASSAVGAALGIAAAIAGAAGSRASATAALVPVVTMVIVPWLYFSVMESSSQQATLGKMAFGIVVTDASGARIGFGRATARFFGKLVSAAPLLVGFLLAGFTRRKQALHDLLAGTLVVRRRETGVAVIVVAAVAILFVGTALVGIVAAIAIPNFIRYQLRSKAVEGKANLVVIAKMELETRQRTGRFVALQVPASGTPGAAKMPWSTGDLDAAQSIDWPSDGASYFRYRVAVDGEAFSACAESDLDGDGQVAAYALFRPDATGHAPRAPCPNLTAADRTADLEPGDPAGEVVQLTRDNVF